MSDQKKQVQKTVEIQQSFWNYPVPPPEMMNKLNQVDARMSGQFLDEWKNEGEHRRNIELEASRQRQYELEIKSSDVNKSHIYDRHALNLSFAIIMTLIGVTSFFVATGKSTEALVAVVTAIALFLYRKKQK